MSKLYKPLYWITRIISSYAVWLLTSWIFCNVALSLRGYTAFGGEYILCVLFTATWFGLFKELFYKEDKQ